MIKDLYDPEVEKRGIMKYQIKLLHEMKMNEKEISQKLKLPIETVKEIIKELKSNSTVEEESFDMVKDLYDSEVEKKGKIEGKIEVWYTEMKMSEKEIAQKLKIPIEVVKEIIKELKL
ncbi:hypothetical protein AN643_04195 [Candidatus Epulonipiscioides saccharophilum]|nr:hypothetical protein AN643_04195 [Epulopiscium sp. SCG-B10WGA-EpuloB]